MATLTGGDKLMSHLAGIAEELGQGKRLRVGFLESETYPDGTPVAQVAFWDEYGTKKSPPRSFFRSMIAEKKSGWGAALGRNLVATGYDADLSLRRVGMGIKDQLTQSIVNFNSVPNSPVTDLLKQRFPMRDGMQYADVLQAHADVAAGESAPAGKPLVWTGQMQRAVEFDIKE